MRKTTHRVIKLHTHRRLNCHGQNERQLWGMPAVRPCGMSTTVRCHSMSGICSHGTRTCSPPGVRAPLLGTVPGTQVRNKPKQETELPFTSGWRPTPAHGQVSQIQGHRISNSSSFATYIASHHCSLIFQRKLCGFFWWGREH